MTDDQDFIDKLCSVHSFSCHDCRIIRCNKHPDHKSLPTRKPEDASSGRRIPVEAGSASERDRPQGGME